MSVRHSEGRPDLRSASRMYFTEELGFVLFRHVVRSGWLFSGSDARISCERGLAILDSEDIDAVVAGVAVSPDNVFRQCLAGGRAAGAAVQPRKPGGELLRLSLIIAQAFL